MSLPEVKKYLAWDTSSITGVVAAFEVRGTQVKEVASWSLSLETSKHSERLLWSIDTVLQSAGWTLKDLNGIAVGIGPGSFTGIRIGITTARMLASALSIPVAPLSSLAILARNAVERVTSLDKTLVVACTDAAKGEWFHLLGNAEAVKNCVSHETEGFSGSWGKNVLESVLAPEVILQSVRDELNKLGPEAKWIAVGQSIERFPDLWSALPKEARILPQTHFIHQMKPQNLILLANEAIQLGLMRPSHFIAPRYLRDSDAEVKLRKGILKVAPILHRGGFA